MQETFLIGFFLVASALLILLVLLAGDLQRRRMMSRRRWYQRRLHTATDRVEALKLEMEPPLEGMETFAAVRSEPLVDPKAQKEPGDLDLDNPQVASLVNELVDQEITRRASEEQPTPETQGS